MLKEKLNNKTPGFFETIVGLMITPFEAARQLFSRPPYPNCVSIIACLVASIYVPALMQIHRYGYNLFVPGVLPSLTYVGCITFLFFSIVEKLFLRCFGVVLSWRKMFSCVVYAISPLICLTWIVYALNYIIEGRLTFLTVLIEGYGTIDPVSAMILPYFIGAGVAYAILVLWATIAAASETLAGPAFMVTLCSLVPLSISFILALFATDLFMPGTIGTLHDLFFFTMNLFNGK